MQITFLGTGTSHGVPIIGCNCVTCSSENPKNKRYRSSIYIEHNNQGILIDTPPELRLQLLDNNIIKINMILFTHPHADHIMGFDDIRAINKLQKEPIPCYGNSYTLQEIKRAFSYIFNAVQVGGGLPKVEFREIKKDNVIKTDKLTIQPLPVKHGKLSILGYRIDDMAYITDCSFISEATYNKLAGINLLILGALRNTPHSTHMNINQALKVVRKLNVKQTYFTHISHEIEHQETNEKLPDNVMLAYDGLKIKC